jgi:hypothetical protein
VIHHDASGGGVGFFLSSTPRGFDPASLPLWLQPGSAFSGSYTAEHAARNDHSIQYGAIATSVALYGPYLRDQALLLMTDNIADVRIINRQRTKSPALQVLLRTIYRV